MMKYLYLNFRLLIFFCLFSILGTYQSFAQSVSNEIHHVIVLIDRSAGMQPKNSSELKNVFNKLKEVCFQKIDSTIGRPLLIPNHDYLSIVTFGLNKIPLNPSDFEKYIQINGSFDKNGFTKYGSYASRNFNDNIFDELYSTIGKCGLRGRIDLNPKSSFFNFPFCYPTVALRLSINHIANHLNGQEFNRTFIIRITDKMRNDHSIDKGSFELSGLNKPVQDSVLSMQKRFAAAYTLKEGEEIEINRVKTKLYQGDYYIQTFLLVPEPAVNIDNLISFTHPFELFRFPDKYSGQLKISKKANKDFEVKNVTLSYKLNNEIIKQDTIFFADEVSDYASAIEIEKYENGDVFVAEASISALYTNDFYKGTLVNERQNPNLIKEINTRFEPKSKYLFFIGLSDKMYRVFSFWGSQKSVVLFLDITGILLLILVIYLIIKIYSNRIYTPKIDQFIIKRIK
jgi:hypothetical protein